MAQTLTAIGALLTGAGTVAGAFSGGGAGAGGSGSKAVNANKPFRGRQVTPAYTFGGGVLSRLDNGILDQERALQSRLSALGATVAPGASASRAAISARFASTRQRVTGDLKTALQQRGLLGASFANDQLAQAEAEMQQQETLALADVFEKEFSQTLAILEQQNVLKQEQMAREMAEFKISSEFLTHTSQIIDKQARQIAEFAAERSLQAAHEQIGFVPKPSTTPSKKAKTQAQPFVPPFRDRDGGRQ